MIEKSGSQSTDHIEIHCRKRVYSFDDDIPRYWAKNNPVITAFYNALSTVTPEGERFFIKNVRHAAEQVEEITLNKDVKDFIEQEASHSIGHRALNGWIQSKGYPVEKSLSYTKSLFLWVNKCFSLKHRLAMTAAIEHFSSVMSDRFLRYSSINEVIEPSMREFLMWHCAEEIEHKAVAFDLYQLLYGGYFSRIFQMLFITLFYIPSVFGVQFRYLHHDRQLFNMKAWWEAVVYFWIKPGWFSRVPSGYVRYYQKNFHPWNDDNSDIVKLWIASSSESYS